MRWGCRKAAYTILAPLFGVGAEFGLAVSLLKGRATSRSECRYYCIWQAVEGRRALAARPGAVSDSE